MFICILHITGFCLSCISPLIHSFCFLPSFFSYVYSHLPSTYFQNLQEFKAKMLLITCSGVCFIQAYVLIYAHFLVLIKKNLSFWLEAIALKHASTEECRADLFIYLFICLFFLLMLWAHHR